MQDDVVSVATTAVFPYGYMHVRQKGAIMAVLHQLIPVLRTAVRVCLL